MTIEPNGIVATCAQKPEDGEDGKIDACDYPEKTFPGLLLKHPIRIDQEHWQSRYFKLSMTLLISLSMRTVWMNGSMHVP